MSEHHLKRTAYIYLLGIFCSSIGTMTYVTGLGSFMPAAGIVAVYIGSLFAATRLTSFLTNVFFGHLGDRFEPRKIAVVCEFLALLGSALIYFSWPLDTSLAYAVFFIGNIVRVFFIALQNSSVQKHAQTLDRELNLNGMMSVSMNRVTQGTLMFGGLLGLGFMEYLDFKTLVIFDALSFVLNGVLIWIFQGKMENANQNAVTNKPKILNFNLSAYLKQHPKLAFEEIMVTLTQAGANTLGIVLLMDQPKLIPILISIFGATVWASSYFMHLPARLWKANAIWWVYAVVLLCIGIFKDSPMHILALFAVAYMCYWILLQRIGKQLMQECPSHNYSQIVASRNAINLAILSSGEVWVGAKLIPLSLELGWRAGVSAIGGIIEKAKK